jgi:hypothetical protein
METFSDPKKRWEELAWSKRGQRNKVFSMAKNVFCGFTRFRQF